MGDRIPTYYSEEDVHITFTSVSDAIEVLKELHQRHPNARLSLEEEYGNHHIVARWERPETDEEKKERLETKKRREQYERKQYEELKKKFEP